MDQHQLKPTRRDAFGRTAMHWCCDRRARHDADSHRVIDVLAKRYPKTVNAPDKALETPLHMACAAGQEAIVRRLLAHKANPNALAQKYAPPLVHAIDSGVCLSTSIHLCLFCFAKCCSIFCYLWPSGNQVCVRLLLEARACVHPVVAFTPNGRQAFRSLDRCAEVAGFPALCAVLRKVQVEPAMERVWVTPPDGSSPFLDYQFACATCGLDLQRQRQIQRFTSLADCVDRCAYPACQQGKSCSVPLLSDRHGSVSVAKVTPQLKMCSRCRSARYCSRQCQLAHWNEHKLSCVATKQLGQKPDQKSL